MWHIIVAIELIVIVRTIIAAIATEIVFDASGIVIAQKPFWGTTFFQI